MFEPDYGEFSTSVACSYREFTELSHGRNVDGNFAHQELVSRLVGSTATGINELLLFHEMGTGKTRTAIAVSERLRKYGGYRGTLVITKGQGTANIFYKEIAEFRRERVVKKSVDEFYTFFTFEMFAKHLMSIPTSVLVSRYDRFVIIVDEVHHVRETDASRLYPLLFSFLHNLKNRKILLMSGTPIRDVPEEIASIMNLILPLNNQMSKKFTESDDDSVERYFYNRVSFVASPLTAVPLKFHGTVPGRHSKLVVVKMAREQALAYSRAWNSDQISTNIYSNSRQASLCTDSRGNYGAQIAFNRTDFGTLAQLSKYSCKYAAVIEALLRAVENRELSIVYADSVNGSGLMLLSRILECYGFSRNLGKSKSFIVLTSSMSEAQKTYYINAWNCDENVFGENASVLLCSRVVSEGYTFKHVLHEHVLTLFWNTAETSQVIARGARYGAHQVLRSKRPVECVNVYIYAAVGDALQSVDLLMNSVSENKDISISKITRILKESAIDCDILKNRNSGGEDFSRRCDFQQCEYDCKFKLCDTPVEKNFNILFFRNSPEYLELRSRVGKILSDKSRILWTEIATQFENIPQVRWVQVLYDECTAAGLKYDEFGIYRGEQFVDDGFFSCLLPAHADVCRDFETFVNHEIVDNFDYARMMESENPIPMLKLLPVTCQYRILTNLLTMNESEFKQHVLKYFKSSIIRQGECIAVHDGSFKWGVCNGRIASDAELDAMIAAKHVRLNSNPTGYYAQENRFAGEFCLKMVETASASDGRAVDRRRIHSGRRCVNWNKSDLVRLCSVIAPEMYAETMNRREMCAMIFDYYVRNDLVEHDDSCGNQHKHKDNKTYGRRNEDVEREQHHCLR